MTSSAKREGSWKKLSDMDMSLGRRPCAWVPADGLFERSGPWEAVGVGVAVGVEWREEDLEERLEGRLRLGELDSLPLPPKGAFLRELDIVDGVRCRRRYCNHFDFGRIAVPMDQLSILFCSSPCELN